VEQELENWTSQADLIMRLNASRLARHRRTYTHAIVDEQLGQSKQMGDAMRHYEKSLDAF